MEECFASGHQPDCVLRPDMSVHSDPEMLEYSSQITFFCGNEPECDVFNGSGALKRAVEVRAILHVILLRGTMTTTSAAGMAGCCVTCSRRPLVLELETCCSITTFNKEQHLELSQHNLGAQFRLMS